MFLALFFVVSALALGWALAKSFTFLDSFLKKTAFAIFTGLFFSAWLALVLYWWVFNGLTQATILAAGISSLAAAALLQHFFKAKPRALRAETKTAALAICVIFIVAAALAAASAFRIEADGSLRATITVALDLPAHLALANSFALGQNHPPAYPFIPSTPLVYPFLADFLTAILVAGGLGLQAAFLLPSILLFLPLIAFTFFFAREFAGKDLAAAFAAILFFFNGGAGVLKLVADLLGGNLRALLNSDYTVIPQSGLYLMNSFRLWIFPQRGAVIGVTAALLVLWVLYRFISKKAGKNELLLAGVISGLLPLAHAHSFIAITIVSFYLILAQRRKEWAWFFIPMIALAIPQVLWIAQEITPGFAGIYVGWVEENAGKNLLEIALFWVKNFPVAILLAIPAYFLLDKNQKAFVTPFVLLFLAANLIRFQPQPWDNFKIILFPMMVFLLLASMALEKIWNYWKNGAKNYAGAALVIIVMFFSIAAGVQAAAWAGLPNSRYQVFSASEFQVADWIKLNTPPEAVFLTGDENNNLITALAGRRTLLGLTGVLETHGIGYAREAEAVARMYQNPACADFKAFGVNYAFVGEEELKLSPNAEFYDDNFRKLYNKTLEGKRYRLYEVEC